MERIYRYAITPNCTVTLPQNYEILNIEWSMMHDEASLWAKVDTDNQNITISLETIPTGETVPPWAHTYLGSFQDPAGLVFHVFKS